MDWRKHFERERSVRALVSRAGVAPPRIAALTALLMARRPAGSPGLLEAAATPDNARAILAAITALEAKLEHVIRRQRRVASRPAHRTR